MANESNKGRYKFPQTPFRKPRFNIMWFYAMLGILIFGWYIIGGESTPVKTSWREVKEMVAEGDVEKIDIINKHFGEVYLKKESVAKYESTKEFKDVPQNGIQFTFIIPTIDIFETDINELHAEGMDVNYNYYDRKNVWRDLLGSIFPIILLIGFWILIMRSMSRGNGNAGGGIFNVGKAKAQVFDKENGIKTTFKDVAGLEEAKVEIMEIVDFLKKPQKYKDLGGKIPKGALLVGPPGTGKTLLAKAVAGEANVPFFSISGSDFVEMFVGVGASRVRDLFRQAKEKAPCIVFIDEIDAIGRARGKNAGFSSNDERENTLNQLLTEMDGFGTNSGVIILAATNRADILDKALMRAGRFDRQIEVGLPDLNERKEIFDVHLKNLKLVKDLDREFLAKQTPGFSGADIANVCNEAALIAARQNKSAIDKQDFLNAIDRIIGGLERRNMIITPEEKRTIAFHEAGHAVVSWKLENANPLIKVTIIPRGKALGAAWYLPEERQITTREQLMDELAAMLGGRMSEQLNLGKISTGALNDLERATKMTYAMVAYYGMSEKVGNMSYYDSTGQSDMAFTKPYSEQTSQEIDREVRKLIDEAMEMARKILQENREGVTELAELLLDREVIFTEDVERIFGKRKKDIEKERLEAEKAAAGTDRPLSGIKPEDTDKDAGKGPEVRDGSESNDGDREWVVTLESELPLPWPEKEGESSPDKIHMQKKPQNTFLIRTASSLVLLGIFLAAVFLSEYTFILLIAIICGGCLKEFYNMLSAGNTKPQKWFGIIAGAGLSVIIFLHMVELLPAKTEWPVTFGYLVLMFFAPFIAELFRKQPAAGLNVASTVCGYIYLAVPLSLMVVLATENGYQPWLFLSIVFIVWANDVGAYLTGVTIGKHKMFPCISPKKTWEGFAGGIVFAIITSIICGQYHSGNFAFWCGLSVLISLTAVVGDLVESMFKRSASIKDSGSIMPGHGGFLDRFDALIFSVPFVWLYFIIFAF